MARTVRDLVWWLAWHGWRALRRLSGDDAYETYIASGIDAPPLSRQRFFERRINLKWDRVTSCGRCFARR